MESPISPIAHTSSTQSFAIKDLDGVFANGDQSEFVLYQKERTPKVVGQYVLGEIIGEGAYSRVREAFDSHSLKRVAIKIMKRKRLRKIPNGEANARREINLLRRLRHPNIINLQHVIFNDEKQKYYVIMEYCVTGLQNLLDRADKKCLPTWQAHSYFCQIIRGLEYLHSHGIVHRDIKPGNILIGRDGVIKITDLGVAEELDGFNSSDKSTSSAGSPAFQPPEIAQGREEFSGFKVDVWAAGVTLYNMVTGTYPFTGSNLYFLFQNIAAAEFTFPFPLEPSLADLITKMLKREPEERSSLDDIIKHEWFSSLPPRDEPGVPLLVGLPPTMAEGVVFSGSDHPPTTTLLPYLEGMFPQAEMAGSSYQKGGGISPSGFTQNKGIGGMRRVEPEDRQDDQQFNEPPGKEKLKGRDSQEGWSDFSTESLNDRENESTSKSKFHTLLNRLSFRKKRPQLEFRDFIGSIDNVHAFSNP